MNNVRVRGYSDITFWQDDGIGLVVLRSDENGMLNANAIGELVAALSTASIDDNVKAVAITGMNGNFCTGLKAENTREAAMDILDAANSLISLVYSLEKPVFAVLSGDAKNYGYELALLSDVIISHNGNEVGFSGNFNFAIGGSVTSLKFPNGLGISKAEAVKNVNLIMEESTLLEDAKKYILDHVNFSYHLLRRRFMKGLRESILEERESFMKNYVASSNPKQ